MYKIDLQWCSTLVLSAGHGILCLTSLSIQAFCLDFTDPGLAHTGFELAATLGPGTSITLPFLVSPDSLLFFLGLFLFTVAQSLIVQPANYYGSVSSLAVSRRPVLQYLVIIDSHWKSYVDKNFLFSLGLAYIQVDASFSMSSFWSIDKYLFHLF